MNSCSCSFPVSSSPASCVASTHVLVDIEALGRRPGSAIVELAAVAFDAVSGEPGRTFSVRIAPDRCFTADLETLEWHRRQGTWPRGGGEEEEDGIALEEALLLFCEWCAALGRVECFWSWGSTYDFPLLDPAFDHWNIVPPWKYYECRCARTVWQLAFPGRRPEKRPHVALEDAVAAARDLVAAMRVMRVPGDG